MADILVTEKNLIVVSRVFGNPNVEVDLTVEGIAIKLAVSKFLAAMVEDVGNPTLLVTKAQLLKALTAAAETVVTDMKQDSTRAWS
jgi:hypothetical protein